MANSALETVFGHSVVFIDSRADALADGVLIDVSYLASEAGFTVPVAVTDTVWSDCIAWSDMDSCRQVPQDPHGRLWDVLSVARWTIRWCQDPTNPLFFDVSRVPRDGESVHPVLTTLKLNVGPGDDREPVGTILFPSED